jgi:anaphase-promoting complex subunit 4
MDAFSSLANIQTSFPSRLLKSACCPDKDLVALITRVGIQDRLALYRAQGGKQWEVDVGNSQQSNEIVGIAWSPDGIHGNGLTD